MPELQPAGDGKHVPVSVCPDAFRPFSDLRRQPSPLRFRPLRRKEERAEIHAVVQPDQSKSGLIQSLLGASFSFGTGMDAT